MNEGKHFSSLYIFRSELFHAIIDKKEEAAKEIILREPSLIKESDLRCAVKNDLPKIVKCILMSGVNFSEEILLNNLIATIKQRKINCFIEILSYVTNINKGDTKFLDTPLHHAAKEGSIEIMKKLLDIEKIDVDSLNENKFTPLHLAASSGHYEIIKLLMKKKAKTLICNNKRKVIPLHLAAEKGKDICCKTLIENSDNPSQQRNKQNNSGNTALIEAAKYGNKNCCQYLVDNKNINTKNNMGDTALHCSAQKGYLFTVQYLLNSCNADYKIRNNKGNTAAFDAASRPNKNTLVEIIEKDEKFHLFESDTNKKGQNILHIANKSFECLSYIIDKNPKLLNEQDKENNTPLHLAIKNYCVDCIELLLETGVDLTIVNKSKKSALHLAVDKDMSSICRAILSKDRSIIDYSDDANQTALHIAAMKGSINCCRMILRKNPRLDVTDREGRNALHFVASTGNVHACKYLIQAGIKFTHDEMGNTPLHIAAYNGHLECCKLLLKSNKANAKLNKDNKLPLDLAFRCHKDDAFNLLLFSCPKTNSGEMQLKIHEYMHEALRNDRK